MDEYRFDWSPAKARAHSLGEQRFYLLGRSARLRLLVVIHAYREVSGVIRLISARKATPSERAQYGAR